jgi:hypothetical protein
MVRCGAAVILPTYPAWSFGHKYPNNHEGEKLGLPPSFIAFLVICSICFLPNSSIAGSIDALSLWLPHRSATRIASHCVALSLLQVLEEHLPKLMALWGTRGLPWDLLLDHTVRASF